MEGVVAAATELGARAFELHVHGGEGAAAVGDDDRVALCSFNRRCLRAPSAAASPADHRARSCRGGSRGEAPPGRRCRRRRWCGGCARRRGGRCDRRGGGGGHRVLEEAGVAPVGQSHSSTSISFERGFDAGAVLALLLLFSLATSARLACSIFLQVSNSGRLQRRQRVAVLPDAFWQVGQQPASAYRHGTRAHQREDEEEDLIGRELVALTARVTWALASRVVGGAVALPRRRRRRLQRRGFEREQVEARRPLPFPLGTRGLRVRSADTVFGYAPPPQPRQQCGMVSAARSSRGRGAVCARRRFPAAKPSGQPPTASAKFWCSVPKGGASLPACARHSRSIRSTHRLVRQTSAAACSTAEATAGARRHRRGRRLAACRAACCAPSTATARRDARFCGARRPPRPARTAGGGVDGRRAEGEAVDAEILRQQRAQRAGCRAYNRRLGTDGAVEARERAVRDERGAVDGSEKFVQLRRRPRPRARSPPHQSTNPAVEGGRDRFLQQCDGRMHVADRLSHSLALASAAAASRAVVTRFTTGRRRGRGWLGA